MSLPEDIDDDDLCAPPGGAEEEELSLPRASINKMIKELASRENILFLLFWLTIVIASFVGSPHQSR